MESSSLVFRVHTVYSVENLDSLSKKVCRFHFYVQPSTTATASPASGPATSAAATSVHRSGSRRGAAHRRLHRTVHTEDCREHSVHCGQGLHCALWPVV